MKPTLWVLAGLLVAASSLADVYKWVDEAGNVHYGDLPPGDQSAESVRLPGISTFKGRPPPDQPPAQAPAPAPFTGYRSVTITQPEADSAVRANDQKVTVAVALDPGLQPGHRMVVLLDGSAIGEPWDGTEVELQGVYRGEHQLQVRIVGEGGTTVAESEAIRFTLRQIAVQPRLRGSSLVPGPRDGVVGRLATIAVPAELP